MKKHNNLIKTKKKQTLPIYLHPIVLENLLNEKKIKKKKSLGKFPEATITLYYK